MVLHKLKINSVISNVSCVCININFTAILLALLKKQQCAFGNFPNCHDFTAGKVSNNALEYIACRYSYVDRRLSERIIVYF